MNERENQGPIIKLHFIKIPFKKIFPGLGMLGLSFENRATPKPQLSWLFVGIPQSGMPCFIVGFLGFCGWKNHAWFHIQIFGGMYMNESGQVFESFNLLIGAIIALTMLAIIVAAISYFDQKRVDVSRQKLIDGYAYAVQQPNGQPLVISEVLLPAGEKIAAKGISERMGISEDCIDLDVSMAPGMASEGPQGPIDVANRVLVNVIITCNANYRVSCEVGCEVKFVGA